uniref:Uncharacterized protein n=1 Tax=uncultured Thiotrichaceae bacterium TaxID=298394 RepID=A0A6S6UKJ9_9GAMM|nr:MAG: Unknown protein [uncultured Thiotrichaceae bacterium]
MLEMIELFSKPSLTSDSLAAFFNQTHRANRKWWLDPHTGLALTKRNRGEMIALMHSELSEAWEGVKAGSADDHLPQYPSLDVEIADMCIRLGDYAGGLKISLHDFNNLPARFSNNFSIAEFILDLHEFLSRLMEAERKEMPQAPVIVELFAYMYDRRSSFPDLDTIIEAKMAYNAERADHKLENRIKEGGKKI